MVANKAIRSAILFLLFVLGGTGWTAAQTNEVHENPPAHHRVVRRHHKKKESLKHKAGWAGAGVAAGHVAGPVGSAAVGSAHYRKDLAAGGKRRTKAVAKIGVPIAIGVAAGPPGSVAYAGYESRHWIKRHVFHKHSHREPEQPVSKP
jgi:hypothetical protein